MEQRNKNLIIVGLIICIFIGCLSPFIASGNPDGLEKTAEDVNAAEGDAVYEAPFPDYTFESLGILGEVLVLIIGTLVALGLGYGISQVIKKRK